MEFETQGERLNHILDQAGFKSGRGRVKEFFEYLQEARPQELGSLNYSTIKGWFQDHSPPMPKIEVIVDLLHDEFHFQCNLDQVKSWWKVGGYYPFNDIDLSSAPAGEGKLKVFHAEDHEIVKTGTKDILAANGINVVGSASTVAETLEKCQEDNPDLLIIDLNMDQGDGIRFIDSLVKRYPDTKILVFSMRKKLDIILAAYQYGAYGYVTKNSPYQLFSRSHSENIAR